MQPPEDPPTNPDGFPPVPPRKQHHWYRPRNIAIGTGALLVGIVVAGVATGSSNDKPAAKPSSNAQPLQAASPVQPVSTPSSDGTIMDWVLSPGYHQMMTVQADVTTLSGDASAEDVAAVEQDGAKLARDARFAAKNPPPVDSGDYSAGMTEYAEAGDSMTTDDFAGATNHLDQGTQLINKVTAALNPAGV